VIDPEKGHPADNLGQRPLPKVIVGIEDVFENALKKSTSFADAVKSKAEVESDLMYADREIAAHNQKKYDPLVSPETYAFIEKRRGGSDGMAYTPGMDERIVTDPTTGGMKGQKDVQLHALPWEALQQLGRIYEYGSRKYEDYNFRKGYAWSLSFDALLRHLFAFWSGEDLDPESGLPHTAHAAWHALTLSLFSEAEKGKDDRPSE